jgi:hypothetical protein
MNDSCGCRSILVRRYQDLHHRLLRMDDSKSEKILKRVEVVVAVKQRWP